MPRRATTRLSEAHAPRSGPRRSIVSDCFLQWIAQPQPVSRPLALLTHTLRGLLVLEYRNDRRCPAQSQLLPPRHHVLVSVLGQFGALGEGLDEAVVHAGIDQALRSPGPDLRRVEAR